MYIYIYNIPLLKIDFWKMEKGIKIRVLTEDGQSTTRSNLNKAVKTSTLAARYNERVCGLSRLENVGSNPAGGHG